MVWWPELLCWGAAVEEEEEEGWGEEEGAVAAPAAPEAAGRGAPSAFLWPRPWYRHVPSLCGGVWVVYGKTVSLSDVSLS